VPTFISAENFTLTTSWNGYTLDTMTALHEFCTLSEEEVLRQTRCVDDEMRCAGVVNLDTFTKNLAILDGKITWFDYDIARLDGDPEFIFPYNTTARWKETRPLGLSQALLGRCHHPHRAPPETSICYTSLALVVSVFFVFLLVFRDVKQYCRRQMTVADPRKFPCAKCLRSSQASRAEEGEAAEPFLKEEEEEEEKKRGHTIDETTELSFTSL
jgi:hypothetical protein